MCKRLLLVSFIIFLSSCQLISEANFILGASYTKSYLWPNGVGVSMIYTNVAPYLNNSLFQGYQFNSYFKVSKDNLWAASIKIPLGHKFNCTGLSINNTNVICNFDSVNNSTYWDQLGNYVFNCLPSPYWMMGYDIQGTDLTNKIHRNIFLTWINKVYKAIKFQYFTMQLVDYGDQMVQRGYKTSYTPQDFQNDIDLANEIAYVIGQSGPGITENASPDWLKAVELYATQNYYGHFTVRAIVFKDPTKVTIEALLSDNSTKYYLSKRFALNSSYSYTNFINLPLGISDLMITTGPGVDGVTNTFAAALWAVDFFIEGMMYNLWDIHYHHQIYAGNFQSILGPAPSFQPSALYYGLIFASIIRDQKPQIVLPSQKAHISSKIKSFGLSTGEVFGVVLLNKDTNTTLNGTVLIKSELTGPMTCIYMEAPSLASKTGIKIAGYNYQASNTSVNGTFYNKIINYSKVDSGHQIPIKYAQAVYCTTADSKFEWPFAKAKFQSTLLLNSFLALAFYVLIF